MLEEKIYEVCWQGPYKPKSIEKKIDTEDMKNFVLYKVYGSHPMYGSDILLYIGMTEKGINNRLNQHNYWMDEENFNKSKIYVASIGDFKDWSETNTHKNIVFKRPARSVIEKIEALLIYAHQPSHNIKNRRSAKSSQDIRIFNTEKYGSLMPEVSSLFYNI